MIAQVEGFHLSPQQRYLYASDKEQRMNQCEVSLTGRLDVAALQAAIQATVDRHEILRTTFHRLPGMSIPLQRVEKTSAISFTAHDLRHLNGQEQEAEFRLISGREAKSPIDLQSGPVLRARAVSCSPEEHILILTAPALCADRRSLENVLREISILYNAAGDGSFLEDPIQYADAASMLNQFAEADPSEPGKRFWSQQEIGKYLDSPIPYQAATPLEALRAQRSVNIEISSRLVEKLDSTCWRLQMSRKVFLLSCWQILFVRLGGEHGFCTGVTFDGRVDEALSDAVGPYEKRLPFITELQPEMSVKEVLLAMSCMIENLITWQDDFCCEQFDFDAETQLPGATFGWCFDYYSRLNIAADGPLSFKLTKLISEADRFKVLLSIVESGSELSAQLQYDPSNFEPEDVKRLSEQFQTLLADAIENPDAGIMELKVLPESERAFLLRELNLTDRDYAIDCCAHHLFERQVRRNPDALAVVFNDQHFSYAELNAKSNQLARKLQKLDVGPEVKVGLCMQRTPEMLVGILGILKAGGAYVPLDPVLPSERLGYMLRDSQSRVLVTQKGIELNFPQVEVPSIYLDSEGSEIKEESADDLSSDVKPSSLAYVIYTSGSTGKPKGVAIEHRQLVNYVLASRERIGFGAHSFALLSTVAADLGNTSLFGALCAGGSLHLISQEVALDGKELAAYFRRHPIDCVKITPSHLAGLIASGAADILPNLRLVLGGEASDWASVEQLQELKPDCSIFNHYGPTETTIGCCLYSAQRSENRSGSVPIGNPLPNIRLYVLDQEGQPVPLKVAGELYIGGAGVGRGYLNKPALTAERYVPDGFSRRKGDRLYRTGDVVRWNGEGELEFIGRSDKQVKIRGHRVELGEVEAALSTCPGVAQAAVLAEGDGAQARLVAYVVGKLGQAPTDEQLHQHLHKWLPAHMVPAAYVAIKQMPLTANGKIDRKALQQMERSVSLRREYKAARVPLEEVLCGIWEQVLEVERVGVEDNFFEMGGHSLLATQVISRIRDVLRVELPLRILFESPTVAALAREIERAKDQRVRAKLEMLPVSRQQQLPLSYAQQRLWFIDQLEPGSSAYNVPTAVRLRGLLDVAALRRCLNEIVRRHEVLRTSFPLRDSQPFQHISPSSDLDLPFIDLSDEPVEQAEATALWLADQETQRPFDLCRGPLIRALLLRLAEADHVLVVTMHHVVSDGWSVAILVREFMQLYASFSSGQPSSLEELTLQYADFAVWQRNYLKGEVLDEQMKYWKGQLEGVSPLELPTDRPRPPVSSHAGERVRFTWGQELTAHLKALARREGATLFMVLLAGFQLLLSRYSRQSDVAIGTDVANRNLTAIESLIGFFINQLVLRCRLDPRDGFERLLKQAREVTLGAYEHQDLPFEKLVDELSPRRDMSRAPLFQVKLVLHNTPREQLSLASLRLEGFGLEHKKIKLDLNLMFEERADQLMGALNYSTDLFDLRTAQAMVEHLRVLLAAAVADPKQPVGQLPLMSQEEREQVLYGWNDTRQEYGEAQCVQEMFEQQVRKTPGGVAVVYEGEMMSYEELNRRANQLGHYLRRLGVEAEVRVALSLPRGLSMIVGLLGVVKAGGTYVPLDLTCPPQRLANMLEDSGAAVVLTEEPIRKTLPAHWAQTICLDRDWPEIAAESADDLPLTTLPEDLLYVIYTSGSTGKPKGVAVEQRQMYHYVSSIVSRLGLRQGMKMALVSSIATDLGHTVLYPALCMGGELHLIPTEMATDPVALGRYNQQRQIECLKITPTHLATLMQADPGKGLLPSRLLVLGGEACQWDWVSKMTQVAPECRIENHYGPTECTVGVITHQVGLERPDSRPGAGVPLGRPLNNVEVYVLDEGGKEVPVGVIGELYVGGSGVTRGYLNNAEATAERYVPDGLSGRKGDRLYRTGNLVKWSQGGDLVFAGRSDYQVKIRGHRVELGEVEAALSTCPGVAQAAVLAEGDGAQARLVAYVVGKLGQAPTDEQLHQHLHKWLPAHMMPAVYAHIKQMPLMANGKIDRKALQQMERSVSLRREYKAARVPLEEVLCGIWEQVLEVERVGVEDNFFEMGGHSLLATQVISRIRDVLRVELPLRILFESPTVEKLTLAIPEYEQTQGQAGKIAAILKKVKQMSAQGVANPS